MKVQCPILGRQVECDFTSGRKTHGKSLNAWRHRNQCARYRLREWPSIARSATPDEFEQPQDSAMRHRDLTQAGRSGQRMRACVSAFGVLKVPNFASFNRSIRSIQAYVASVSVVRLKTGFFTPVSARTRHQVDAIALQSDCNNRSWKSGIGQHRVHFFL